MKILGIDTSTMMGAVGLVDGNELVAELRTNVSATHSERLMSHVDGLLKAARVTLAELDGFAVGLGPGSFTGLRIGIATAKGLAYATGKPIVGVGTLAAMADNAALSPLPVCPALDARKKMVYAALYRYEDGAQVELSAPAVLMPDELVGLIRERTLFLGEGARVYGGFLAERLGDNAVFAPDALSYPTGAAVAFRGHAMLASGRADDPFSLVPFYIRKSEAEEKAAAGAAGAAR